MQRHIDLSSLKAVVAKKIFFFSCLRTHLHGKNPSSTDMLILILTSILIPESPSTIHLGPDGTRRPFTKFNTFIYFSVLFMAPPLSYRNESARKRNGMIQPRLLCER